MIRRTGGWILAGLLALAQGLPAPPPPPATPPPVVVVSAQAPPLTLEGIHKTFPSYPGWSLTTFPFSALRAARGYPYQLMMLGPSGWTPVDPVNHPEEVDTSLAYMSYAEAPGKNELVGAPDNPDHVTRLHPGWNLLGVPSSVPVKLDRLTFTAPGGVSRVPSEADRWINPVIQVQDAAGQRTRDVRQPGKQAAQPGATAYIYSFGELQLNWNLVPPARKPHIDKLSAPSLAPGQVLEITGSGFGQPGQGQLTLGGVPIQPEAVQSWSDGKIRLAIPPAARSGNLIAFINRYPGNRVPFAVQSGPAAALGNLTGRVLASDGSPLVGALVEIDDGFEARSGPDGGFVMARIPSGPHRVYISLPGYKSGQGDIALGPGETRNLMVSLSPAGARPAPNEESVRFTVQAYAFEQSAGRRWWPSRIEVWEYGTNRRNWVRSWDRDLGNTYELINCDGGLVRRDYNVRITWKSGPREQSALWTPELERADQTFSYYHP